MGETRKVPVEVIVNGQSVAKTEITADGSVEGVSFDVPIKKSSWVALRVYPSSHTNPVFVTVGGKPIRASKKSAEWCLKSVDQCWSKKSRRSERPKKRPPRRHSTSPARHTRRSSTSARQIEPFARRCMVLLRGGAGLMGAIGQ